MKNKNINAKLDSLSKGINSVKSKAENAKYLKESGVFQTLESELEAAIVLQKDVQTLKDLLKAKTEELAAGIKKLKKSSKDARKILKKDKKPVKLSKEGKIQDEKFPAGSKISGSKKKTGKSKTKPAKHKN